MKKGIFRPNASAGYMEHLSYFNFKPSKPLLFINISGISCFDCHQPCTIKVCFELLLELFILSNHKNVSNTLCLVMNILKGKKNSITLISVTSFFASNHILFGLSPRPHKIRHIKSITLWSLSQQSGWNSFASVEKSV